MRLVLPQEARRHVILVDEAGRGLVKLFINFAAALIKTDSWARALFVGLGRISAANCGEVTHLLLLQILVPSLLFLFNRLLQKLRIALPRVAAFARRVILITACVGQGSVVQLHRPLLDLGQPLVVESWQPLDFLSVPL